MTGSAAASQLAARRSSLGHTVTLTTASILVARMSTALMEVVGKKQKLLPVTGQSMIDSAEASQLAATPSS